MHEYRFFTAVLMPPAVRRYCRYRGARGKGVFNSNQDWTNQCKNSLAELFVTTAGPAATRCERADFVFLRFYDTIAAAPIFFCLRAPG